jgi:3-isopropylmalate dehydratase small subunit
MKLIAVCMTAMALMLAGLQHRPRNRQGHQEGRRGPGKVGEIAMNPVHQVDGLVAPLDRANVDTDAIIPKQYLKSIKRSGFGPTLFDEWRYHRCRSARPGPLEAPAQPGFRAQPTAITRGPASCWCARISAVDHRANTHRGRCEDFGFRAIIGTTFADIFFNNCFKNGLLPIRLPQPNSNSSSCSVPARRATVCASTSMRRPSSARWARDPLRRRSFPQGMSAQRLRRHRPDLAPCRKDQRLRSPQSHRATLAFRLNILERLKVCVIPGDGIGIEITAEALRVLEALRSDGLRIEFEHALLGGCAVDATGDAVSRCHAKLAREADAILLGAVGGPQWDVLPREQRPERGLLRIRKRNWACSPTCVRPSSIRSWPMPRR